MRILAVLAAAALLAGCAPQRQPEAKAPEEHIDGFPEDIPPKPARPKRDGKYYKDDGPPDVDEVDWRTVPDATIAFAPIDARRNRPYEVFGVRYVPYTQFVEYRQQGEASWYGRRYHGRKTSSGEVYDMYAMTAAHTVLPIPSYARVTRVDDGRSIVVRINDRGPFLQSRLIDLSYTAARKLGVVADGTAIVLVEAILPSNGPQGGALAETDLAPEQGTAQRLDGLEGSYLQLGAFASHDNATGFIESIRLPTTLAVSRLVILDGGDDLKRVVIGPYPDKEQARQDLQRLHDWGMEALLKVFQ